MSSRVEELVPFDVEAERALLGAAMSGADTILDVVALVDADDLYLDRHQIIWSAIRELALAGSQIDEVTVIGKLREAGTLKAAGGASGVAELTSSLPAVAGMPYYGKMVKADSARRRLIKLGRSMVLEAQESKEVRAAIDEGMRVLLEVASGISPASMRDAASVADAVVAEALLVARGQQASAVLSTGMRSLDDRVFLRHGKLVGLGGTAGTGKTSFALQIADQVATAGGRVLFVTLEMSAEEITERLLAARTGIPVHEIERGILSPEKQAQLNAAACTMPKGLFIEDSPGTSPLDIRAQARQIQLRGGLSLVVVDYLQRLTPTSRGRSREQEVSEMSRELKLVTRSLDVPLIVLSQLSRAHEREGRKPQRFDFRESGAIEQDCDILMALYREARDEGGTIVRDTATEVIVLKQRQGPEGMFMVEFDPVRFRFGPLTGGF